MFGVFDKDRQYLDDELAVKKNFDVVSREITVGGRRAVFYFVDGFCKDDLMVKLLQFVIEMQPRDMPMDAKGLNKIMPYVEVEDSQEFDVIVRSVLSGYFALLIEEFTSCVLIDSRTYPARGVEQPDKDKALRGSRDGFVETIIFNTALVRRRIRSSDLRVEHMQAGVTSKTDIALCYMDSRVDQQFLETIKKKIQNIKADALTMNQESLAECLYQEKWFNPLPKFKYTERPDAAVAQILEGNIIILVDNSPSAMILPTSILDIVEEADDYYFPPITGTYLRIARLLTFMLNYFLTPTFLLFMQNPQWIPETFQFTIIEDVVNIPLVWQFLILEFAIDGLKLAAVNTPSMLSTPLSVVAAIVLGEFAVKSGWFNSEVMLYMSFVALASYTQQNYELGYAVKFFRMINLVLTACFNLWGYIIGNLIFVIALWCNKTVAGYSYLATLTPFGMKKLSRFFVRKRLPESKL